MARVMVVVPCFNEAKRLDASAFGAFALTGHELTFVFVNDGSTDATMSVLSTIRDSAKSKCEIVDLVKNGGKAEAVRQGMLHALALRPDYVGYWDADLAAPLSELTGFLELMQL